MWIYYLWLSDEFSNAQLIHTESYKDLDTAESKLDELRKSSEHWRMGSLWLV